MCSNYVFIDTVLLVICVLRPGIHVIMQISYPETI